MGLRQSSMTLTRKLFGSLAQPLDHLICIAVGILKHLQGNIGKGEELGSMAIYIEEALGFDEEDTWSKHRQQALQ